MHDLQDRSMKNYNRNLTNVIQGYYKLRYLADTSVDVAYLTPNSLGIAQLPPDFWKESKIGINIGGVLVTLSRNYNLANNPPNPKATIPCPDSIDEVLTLYNNGANLTDCWGGYGYWFASHYRNGQFVGEMYGLGGGLNAVGYYHINETTRTIAFSNVPFATDILMEYIGLGDASQKTVVDIPGVDVCRMYAHWQNAKGDRNYKFGNVADNKLEFENLLNDYKFQKSLPTTDNVFDFFVDNQVLSY